MSDFKAKMHHNRFRLGLRPRPRSRSLQRSPYLDLRGPTSKGRGCRKGGEWGEGGEGRGGEEGRGGKGGKDGKEGRGGDPPCVSLNFP